MPLRFFFAPMILSTLAIVRAFSQTPVAEAPLCNEEFAQFLVSQQVMESRSVLQANKRIRILIRAADFLWKFDEPTGREHLTEAFKVATDHFNEKGFERTEIKGLTSLVPDYRFEVIRAIAVKDPAWANNLIDKILKEYEKAAERNVLDKNRELQDIIRIAEESIKTNPELSRALFRRVMQHPLDYHWFYLLFSISNKNRALADGLYAELLTNYAGAAPGRLLFLSAYPFANVRIFGIDKYQYGANRPDTLTPNRALQQRFIEVFLRRVVSFASDPQNLNLVPEEYRRPEPIYMLSALSELEPIIIQQFPAMMPQLSEAKALASSMLNEQMRKDLSDREGRNEALGFGFEKRLKLVEEAEAEGKLTDHMILNLLAWGDDKTEAQYKLIEPWLEKISEESGRNEAINYFWFLRARLAAKERRFADAERFARKIPELEHRAILFFEIIDAQHKDLNDAATVYQSLREVERLAEQSETSVEKARVLLALTNHYLKINPVFAIQELSDAIKVINRLENPDLSSTTVFRLIRTKNSSFSAAFSLPGYNLEGTFKAISKDNFEMSLSNAKSLEDKYLRTLAVLAVAQNCVDKVKKKAAPRRSAPNSSN